MIKVQICFSATSNLENVKNQLQDLAANPEFEFYHCFMPRHIVEEKGYDTAIVDMLDEVLKNRMCSPVPMTATFETYIKNINVYREDIANVVNRMYVLDSGTADGIRNEIELFTSRKVIMLP